MKEPTLNDVLKIVKELTLEVQELKRVKEVKEVEKVVEPVKEAEQKYPIPQEYREIIDQTLNKHFGIEIKPMSDSPSFLFTIVVPKKYSNLSKDEFEMRGADLRTRVVTYAEGINGIKLWADKVFDNFVPELKAQIIADRI